MNRNYMTFADIEISNRLEKIDHALFKIEKMRALNQKTDNKYS